MIFNNILETIGNTPVVRLNQMGPDHVEMYVKVESFNPMASVKDRLAFAIINDAEQKGTLAPGQTVIEATSGNTGIALAMVCAAKGHQFVATMADSFSVERRQVMRGLGAKVILTPAAERGKGDPDDWPTHRHDSRRGGSTKAPVPAPAPTPTEIFSVPEAESTALPASW